MPARNIRYSGRYHSGVLTGAASADGATSGRFWVINESASGLLLAISRVVVTSIPAAATTIAPTRITGERFTFTGTASGASGTPAPRDTADALSPSVSVRTASTGLVIAAGEVVGAAVLSQAVGTPTNVFANPHAQELFGGGDVFEFRQGQGFVIRQADAGDTDQKFAVDVDFFVYEY